MTAGEIVGPTMHDGMRIEVPDRVVAFAVVTDGPDGYDASLTTRRGVPIRLDELALTIFELSLNVPEETQ